MRGVAARSPLSLPSAPGAPGRPAVVTLETAEGEDADALLRAAVSVESASEHPLANAVVAAARDRGVESAGVSNFESLTGKGVTAELEGDVILLGNAALLEEAGLDVTVLDEPARAARDQAQTVVYVSRAGRVLGFLGIADPIKPGAQQALTALREHGVDIVMLTGDNPRTAAAVAAQLGIERVEAGVLPQRKSEVVAELIGEGRVVAMAGDGINDAPALARAHVGIAMGTGTDIAMESAGVTLVKGDLNGILRARLLSRATMRNIRQNLFFAFVYNSLGVPIAAGLLYPWFGLLLSPMIAALAMSLSSVSVIGNALRLRRAKLV